MSYLVIARKWRPQTFDRVVGQPHVTRTLQNAIHSGRIAHAYLFTGARGVGKTSVARILAKALNCERGVSPTPCGECSNCKEITQSRAVDVLEIDGASNRGIDSIRELRETVRYRPAKSSYKIYIIDEVHMLTTEAFNALLKTLEEPPEHVLFIFATTEPHKIPSTILSRCQRFDFRRVPAQALVKQLREIADEEHLRLSDTVLYALAREADGSMRDAQSLLEQLLAFSGDGLEDEEILDVLGVVDRRSVHRAGEAVLKGDVQACFAVVEDLYRRGVDSRRFCRQLCDHFRNLLFTALSHGGAMPDVPEEERAALERDVAETTSESLYLYFQMLLKGEEDLRRSTLPRIALEMLLLRMAQLPRLESLERLIEKVERIEEGLTSGQGGAEPQVQPLEQPYVLQSPPLRAPHEPREGPPVRAARLAEPTDSQEMPLSEGAKTSPVEEPKGSEKTGASMPEAVERWPQFLEWLERREPVLGAKLSRSRVSVGPDNALVLEILELFENAFKEPQTMAKLTDAAVSFFRTPFQWVVQGMTTQGGLAKAPSSSKSAKVNPKRMVMEHPMVLQAIEVLGGELQEIRPWKSTAAGAGKRAALSEPESAPEEGMPEDIG